VTPLGKLCPSFLPFHMALHQLANTVAPFRVCHKLYYFHFCWIKKKKNTILNVKNLKNLIKVARFKTHDHLNKVMKPFISLTKSISRNINNIIEFSV
jgi:hypothetical protein